MALMDPQFPHPSPPRRLLEVHEVAYVLKCSQETVRRLIRNEELPASRPFGRSLRVKAQDLDALIDARRVNGVTPSG